MKEEKLMEKQVYIIKGSITSLLLANLQLWGPFLFQIKKGQSVTLSTPKSVWDFNINNSCLPLLILTHNMEYTTWFWQISMLVYHTAFEINSCLFLHKKHNDQKNAPNNELGEFLDTFSLLIIKVQFFKKRFWPVILAKITYFASCDQLKYCG